MWQFATGLTPWEGTPSIQIAAYVANERIRPPFPAHIDPTFVNLAQHCWSHRPQDRPSAAHVVRELGAMLGDNVPMTLHTQSPACERRGYASIVS